jgi:PhnB protein
MQVHAYLVFDGNCREAFAFYRAALGAEVEMLQTVAGSPAEAQSPKAFHNKILHGRLRVGETLLMGADAPGGRYQKPEGTTLTLSTDTAADADKFFAALSAGGEVRMPLAETFFAERFGILTDKFNIPWMIIKERRP